MINHGGGIIAPELVEEVLKTVPGVKDVAVFGVPNARGVEEIWAAIVSETPIDPARIVADVRGRLLGKVPERIVRVNDLPRTEVGKVKRGAVREMVLAERLPPDIPRV